MDPYELYEKDFDEFVRLGIESFFGDHPGEIEQHENDSEVIE